MIAIAAKPSLSFEEYLKYNDGTDNRYEFFDGELIRNQDDDFNSAVGLIKPSIFAEQLISKVKP